MVQVGVGALCEGPLMQHFKGAEKEEQECDLLQIGPLRSVVEEFKQIEHKEQSYKH